MIEKIVNGVIDRAAPAQSNAYPGQQETGMILSELQLAVFIAGLGVTLIGGALALYRRGVAECEDKDAKLVEEMAKVEKSLNDLRQDISAKTSELHGRIDTFRNDYVRREEHNRDFEHLREELHGIRSDLQKYTAKTHELLAMLTKDHMDHSQRNDLHD